MKKSFSLIIGMGKPKSPEMGDEGEDLHGEEKAAAGKALASAIKGGDGAEIADAFRALMDACQDMGEASEEMDEAKDDMKKSAKKSRLSEILGEDEEY